MQYLLSKTELCQAMRLSQRRFDELRPKLQEKGFPRPVPGLGARWHRLAVEEWLDQAAGFLPGAAAGGEVEPGPKGSTSAIQRAQAALEARYGRPAA